MGQGFDALDPFAQRGQMDSQYIDAVVEVLTKITFTYEGFYVAVGGRNDAGVGMNGFVAPQTFKCFVFDGPQQFGLQLKAQFTKLIQKDRAAVGLFKPSRSGFVGPGKRAFLMAEKLAFEQRLRYIGAIYLNKRFLAPRAVEMNVAGQKAFAGSGFTGHQDR